VGARARESTIALAAGLAAAAAFAWLGVYYLQYNDYGTEAAPALGALIHGHLHRFLTLAPAYGGSLELRAPFALLPSLWGGGATAVFRAAALPCLIAGALFGTWLLAQMRAAGHGVPARWLALALCAANPLAFRGLQIGHPEELLGAVLAVAAVFSAQRGRPLWAGLLLGLAIANKQWALLAVGPVLLALPRDRIRTMLVAGAITVALLAPLAAVHSGGIASATRGIAVTQTGTIFRPQQAWWFFGDTRQVVHDLAGRVQHGWRTPPAWLDGRAHLLIVWLGLPLTLLCLRRRRREGDALLLLALLMLLRCVLDPWDFVYYPLPFILALLSWETLARRSFPVRSLAATGAAWLLFRTLPGHVAPDTISLIFLALTAPAVTYLCLALYRPRAFHRRTARVIRPSAAPS
jgi:hypothetical protein